VKLLDQVEDMSARQVYEKLLEAVQPWSSVGCVRFFLPCTCLLCMAVHWMVHVSVLMLALSRVNPQCSMY